MEKWLRMYGPHPKPPPPPPYEGSIEQWLKACAGPHPKPPPPPPYEAGIVEVWFTAGGPHPKPPPLPPYDVEGGPHPKPPPPPPYEGIKKWLMTMMGGPHPKPPPPPPYEGFGRLRGGEGECESKSDGNHPTATSRSSSIGDDDTSDSDSSQYASWEAYVEDLVSVLSTALASYLRFPTSRDANGGLDVAGWLDFVAAFEANLRATAATAAGDVRRGIFGAAEWPEVAGVAYREFLRAPVLRRWRVGGVYDVLWESVVRVVRGAVQQGDDGGEGRAGGRLRGGDAVSRGSPPSPRRGACGRPCRPRPETPL